MIRTSTIALTAAILALGACQPEKPSEPTATEQSATAETPVTAPATASVDPAASAYLAGADKVFALLADSKDLAAVEAVKPQVTAIYTEMAAPAATLKAMTPEQRAIAFGSEAAKADILNKVGATLSGHSYNPETLQAVGALIDQMPEMD